MPYENGTLSIMHFQQLDWPTDWGQDVGSCIIVDNNTTNHKCQIWLVAWLAVSVGLPLKHDANIFLSSAYQFL